MVVGAWPFSGEDWVLILKGCIYSGHARTPKTFQNFCSNICQVGSRKKLRWLKSNCPNVCHKWDEVDPRNVHRVLHAAFCRTFAKHLAGDVSRCDQVGAAAACRATICTEFTAASANIMLMV